MKDSNSPNHRNIRRMLLTACAAALVAAVALPHAAYADEITVPPVPDGLKILTGDRVFLVGHAVGTQNYVCLPTTSGVAFSLFTPEATLFDDGDEQIITHFFAPNPDEKNTNPALSAIGPIRAAWQHSRDSSAVFARVVKPENASTDARFVEKDAVAWLLLTAVGHKIGPTGGDVLAQTTFVQRLSTSGGVAPSTGCTSSADIGHLAFVPYTADYFFYRAPRDPTDR